MKGGAGMATIFELFHAWHFPDLRPDGLASGAAVLAIREARQGEQKPEAPFTYH